MHRKVNPLLGPGPGGVGNVWFSEPHYLIGKGRPLSRPLSHLPIDVSLYPSSRSRNCRSIGVSHTRSLEHSKTVAILESRALWHDCKSHQAPTSKRRGLGGYADAKVRLRGLCLRGRARGCKPCPNTMELCPK